MRYIPNKSCLIELMNLFFSVDLFVDFSLINTNNAIEVKMTFGLNGSKNLRSVRPIYTEENTHPEIVINNPKIPKT